MTGSKLLRGWTPLNENVDTDHSQFVPFAWDGPHVGKRLIETFAILRRVPVAKGPKKYGSAWPSYIADWEDLLAQRTADLERLEEIEQMKNRTRIQPTAREIATMEIAIAWPGRYLSKTPQLAKAVGLVALTRSLDRDLEFIAKQLRMAPRTVARLESRRPRRHRGRIGPRRGDGVLMVPARVLSIRPCAAGVLALGGAAGNAHRHRRGRRADGRPR